MKCPNCKETIEIEDNPLNPNSREMKIGDAVMCSLCGAVSFLNVGVRGKKNLMMLTRDEVQSLFSRYPSLFLKWLEIKIRLSDVGPSEELDEGDYPLLPEEELPEELPEGDNEPEEA